MPLIETKGAASAQGFGEFLQQGPVNYIEDVFSTYLYTGNATARSITNNINLSTNGGLVWIKERSAALDHNLFDTNRGAGYVLYSNLTNGQSAFKANTLTSFDTTGFSLGTDAGSDGVNRNGQTYASWTFRKQAKFFDVVTYTGNGANRTISHNLGSVPGCIIVKRTDTTADWQVYHRSLANTEYMVLNTTAAVATGTTRWNSTTPTSTVFSLGTDTTVNASGGTYVAYLFAHDAGGFGLSGTDNVISCGSYTGNGSTTGPTVTLGYEPQWVLVKDTSFSGQWWTIVDNMRGWTADGNTQTLAPNDASAELTNSANGMPILQVSSTGFSPTGNNNTTNGNGRTYIYIAIRRGPMKVPTSGTSVFRPYNEADNVSQNVGFPTDMFFDNMKSGLPSNTLTGSRLIGTTLTLSTASAAAETTIYGPFGSFANNTNYAPGLIGAGTVWYAFRRAPGFFDEVCYTGTGTNGQTYNHNLGATPELMIIKRRNAARDWITYSVTLGAGNYLSLNGTAASTADSTMFNSTAPTSTMFSVGTSSSTNDLNSTYVAYLFATCAGVSKVGSYTGTGALQTVNCGFTSGARFVLIKRTDSTGDWYVYDSARGISSGNDPYLFLNSTAAEVTGTNYVDTTSVGFQVTAAAPAGLNANGGTYIFLAIA